jgi:hypothetical protein
MLFHQGCTESRLPEQAEIKYDIQGEWDILMIEMDRYKFKRICTFIGTKKRGTVVPTEGESGTYNAGGEHGIAVEFFFWTYYPDGQKVFEYYLGEFIDENYMEGTGRYKGEEEPYPYRTPFAWGAHRIN